MSEATTKANGVTGAAKQVEDSPKPKATRPPRKAADADRFGPRRADVTHWRCKHLERDKKQTLLFWGDEDVEESEWPIETLTLGAIRQRWGAGEYIVEFYGANEQGARVMRGKSQVVRLRAPAEVLAPTAAPQPAPAVPPAVGTDISTVFSLMAFLEDRSEKARMAAAAEAKLAIERTLAEAKLAHDRYRADLDAQMERERLASKERIAQMEVLQRGVRTVPAPAVNTDELVAKLGELIETRVRDTFEEYAPESGPSSAPVEDKTAATIKSVTDALMPIVSLVAANLAPKAPPLPSALPPEPEPVVAKRPAPPSPVPKKPGESN
jgi:hypothetical protein